MEDGVVNRALKTMHHIRLNLIDGSISSYCYIINSPERIYLIKEATKLAYILGDI